MGVHLKEPARQMSMQEPGRCDKLLVRFRLRARRVVDPDHPSEPTTLSEPQASPAAEVHAALRRGDCIKAYDMAMRALERTPEDFRLRYLAVLALARSGAAQRAQELYHELDLGSREDSDTRALPARLLKDLAFEVGEDRPARMLEAAKAYHLVYEKSAEYFPGINAATLFLLAGDTDIARRLATALLRDPVLRNDETYWGVATVAEAELVLGRTADAMKSLTRARALAADDFGSLASTRLQLARIVEHQGADSRTSELLAVLSVPLVGFFCGHMVATPHSLEEEWQRRLSADIGAAIDAEGIGFAYGGLACGADILFAEAFLQRGAELHVVFPFQQDDFIAQSVRPGGAPWIDRFHRCLERAKSVTFATSDDYVDDPWQFSYGAAVAMGMAQLRAQQLQTQVRQLAAWDGIVKPDPGGTASNVDDWRKSGGKSRIIPFQRPDATAKAQGGVAEIPGQYGQAGGTSRHLRSIIFADVQGFSKLPESRIPKFWNGVMGRCAETIERFGEHVIFRNTWGDAIYLVIDDVSAAADLALSLHDSLTLADPATLGLEVVPTMRIGLHHGPLYEGRDPVRKQTNFYGSQVSRTARIEPITPPGAVYVTEPFAAVLAMTGDRSVVCSYVGEIDLAKGYGTYRMYRLSRAKRSRMASRQGAQQGSH
jgi:class 3 adenylate cyclase